MTQAAELQRRPWNSKPCSASISDERRPKCKNGFTVWRENPIDRASVAARGYRLYDLKRTQPATNRPSDRHSYASSENILDVVCRCARIRNRSEPGAPVSSGSVSAFRRSQLLRGLVQTDQRAIGIAWPRVDGRPLRTRCWSSAGCQCRRRWGPLISLHKPLNGNDISLGWRLSPRCEMAPVCRRPEC